MITLSYSTISGCLQPNNSHNWLNKIYRVPFPENEYMRNGKRLHTLAQEHFSGRKKYDYLEHIPFDFPIVEERAFDPRCRVWHKFDEDFYFHGFTDGRNPSKKNILECKFSNTMWSIGKFKSSMQIKCYAFCLPEYDACVGLTGVHDETTWGKNKPKSYLISFTDQDRADGRDYITKAIELVKSGDFSGGLDPDGICRDQRCTYGSNCSFKQ